VVMATPLNKRVLKEMGIVSTEVDSAGSDDLIVAVNAKDKSSADSAVSEAQRLLSEGGGAKGGAGVLSTLDQAVDAEPGLNLAVISVPGRFAKREAAAALERGLNVFLFSSNVSRADELELKKAATARHLLLMGPDCGTAIINHKILGFGNQVREGNIGLVSASGTGLQEVAVAVHNQGGGISQAIGTGGGDLSEEVGGLMTIQALALLEDDPETDVIVVVSKPPSARARSAVLSHVRTMKKPVVVNFIGEGLTEKTDGNISTASTLEKAADMACRIAGVGGSAREGAWGDESSFTDVESTKLAKSQLYLRGLFAGGTLCYEAQAVLRPVLGKIHSNSPLDARLKIPESGKSIDHTCIDMGAEEFVVGRAHPMIDSTLRKLRIIEEAKDPQTAVILLDVELGMGSNPDPAGELAPAIKQARSIAAEEGRHLPVIVSVLGTKGDFQGLEGQVKKLEEAGAFVTMVSSRAAMAAGAIISHISSGTGNKGSES
ncbi:MAG TPA: hypothetical protein VFE91_03330, partial [Nitrososphaerales archaeon]|nr:hypothetical protein [Nitrososphaerales archaeon]